jgi:hypothetical protein
MGSNRKTRDFDSRQSTMPDHVAEKLSNGQDVFGVLIVPRGVPIGVSDRRIDFDCWL